MYVNSRDDIESVLGIFGDLAAFATTVCWDLGQIRSAPCYREMWLAPTTTPHRACPHRGWAW